MGERRMSIRLIILLVMVLLLACGCYGPSESEGTCIGNTYRACVDGQAAVNWLGICNETCQADCRVRAVEACR